MSTPNSVGGRYEITSVINSSKKTVKYITIRRMIVNNFCEPARCEIDGEWMTTCRIVGPITGNPQLISKSKIPKKFIHNYQSTNIHYNSSATKSIIGYCKIEFTDGSIKEYINSNYIDVQLMKYKNSMGEYYNECECKEIVIRRLITGKTYWGD